MEEEDYTKDLDREVRLVLYIPVGYMKILDVIKGNSSISKKGIVIRALRDYFYKHRKLLNVDKMEEFLIEYLEGR